MYLEAKTQKGWRLAPSTLHLQDAARWRLGV